MNWMILLLIDEQRHCNFLDIINDITYVDVFIWPLRLLIVACVFVMSLKDLLTYLLSETECAILQH